MIMEQNMQYLRALMYIAAADETISEDEYVCFSMIAVSAGLPEEVVVEIKKEIETGEADLQVILSDITDDKTKKRLLHDLLVICFADDSYSVAEQNGIRDICTLLSVSDKKLAQIEREAKISHSMQKASGTFLSVVNAGAAGTVTLGKKVVDGSGVLLRSVADGLNTVGAKIAFSLESAKKAKEENKALREQLKKTTLTEAIKQKVIVQLGAKIANLTEQLQAERKRNQQNEEMIRELQAQIDDLMETMEVARNARTA
jgi:uncharacterized tellurite resistance protein B-like protein